MACGMHHDLCPRPMCNADTLVILNRYRFRLISMSCDPNFVFTIDGHNMTIIEADGQETEPLLVDSLQIFTAQRYSFIVRSSSFAHINIARGPGLLMSILTRFLRPSIADGRPAS